MIVLTLSFRKKFQFSFDLPQGRAPVLSVFMGKSCVHFHMIFLKRHKNILP